MTFGPIRGGGRRLSCLGWLASRVLQGCCRTDGRRVSASLWLARFVGPCFCRIFRRVKFRKQPRPPLKERQHGGPVWASAFLLEHARTACGWSRRQTLCLDLNSPNRSAANPNRTDNQELQNQQNRNIARLTPWPQPLGHSHELLFIDVKFGFIRQIAQRKMHRIFHTWIVVLCTFFILPSILK